jgi:hypothetical protein
MARERRVSGTRAEGFPAAPAARWDFSRVADDEVYLLRKGRDFDVEVASLAIAARRWAREHGYTLPQRVRRASGGPPQRWGRTFGSRGKVPADGGGPPVRRHAVDPSPEVDSSDTCFGSISKASGSTIEALAPGAMRRCRCRAIVGSRPRLVVWSWPSDGRVLLGLSAPHEPEDKDRHAHREDPDTEAQCARVLPWRRCAKEPA